MLITNIQRMCFHDGKGIRTTVFFKGCSLKCPWCANPENISFEKENIYEDGKIIGTYGKVYVEDDVFNEIMKDKIYYEDGGGVTFSGGEPLIHLDSIENLLKRLKKSNIDICVETALGVPIYKVKFAIKYVDEFIIDVKILKNEDAKIIIGLDLDNYIENIKEIFKQNKRIIFRVPLIYPYTYNDENLEAICEFIKEFRPERIEIFKVHSLAKKKYESLNKRILEIKKDITKAELENVKEMFEKAGVETVICNL